MHKHNSIAVRGILLDCIVLILRYLHSCHTLGTFWNRAFAEAHQMLGFSSMNFLIRSWHSLFSSTMTSIPLALRYASPPTKVLFSPITTRATLYKMQAPVHISHGDKEVYMVAPWYAEAESLPVFSSVEISAFGKVHQSSHLASSAREAYMQHCASSLHPHIVPSA